MSSSDMKNCPPSLCMSLPSSSMKDLSTSFLAEITRDLSGVNTACLLGAKKMFSEKTTLTKTDIESGKAFLQCMSYDDASKVETSEIFDVMEAVTKEDLSWATCRAWKMKIMEWAEEEGVEEEFLKHRYLGEISNIPACVLALFEQDLYDLNPEKKKTILSSLCNSKNYFIIPKEARGKIVNRLYADVNCQCRRLWVLWLPPCCSCCRHRHEGGCRVCPRGHGAPNGWSVPSSVM
ncbi:hypothetical protein E2C01_028122 [Portunus trituberculatus]|uniref:Uncharacterized protein n=1 Tax=Portunus trituberculatus TaxID=210409 RepID=A0A5B7EKI7_PORTR|nr:hypothetical protein [Portunus trituberculatus]